jgi:hypothetical protein
MPSTRLLTGLALATLVTAIGVAEPRLVRLAVLADVLLLVGFLVDLHLARATPVVAERTWPPLLVQGAASELVVRIQGAEGRELRLREALHPGLAAARSGAASTRWDR